MRALLYILILLGFISCKKRTFDTESEYLKWIHNPSNGCFVQKNSNQIKLGVKFIPNEYLVYKELKGSIYTKKTVDSLLEKYKYSRTFLMTIAPENMAKSEGDVMYEGIENYPQYKEKFSDMNFNMESYITLTTDKTELKPVLSALENIYSIGNQRSIYLVFTESEETPSLFDSGKLDLTYSDELFKTGISHFVFEKDNIDNIPKINFWKYHE